MKAKEYAEIAKEGNYDLESVSKVVQGLLSEISRIAKGRNVSTIRGMNGVIQEIRKKWTAIYRRTEGLNEDGFDRFLMEKGLIDKEGKLNAAVLQQKLMGA